MLWTMFVCGLRLSLGGSIGLMAFVVLFSCWDWLTKTNAARRVQEVSELSLQSLIKRNELTGEQLALLERIASAVEGLERNDRR